MAILHQSYFWLLAIALFSLSGVTTAEIWQAEDLHKSTTPHQHTLPSANTDNAASAREQCDHPPAFSPVKSDATNSEQQRAQLAFAEGQIIQQIRLHQVPLFDHRLPEENRYIHRIANKLHRNTRQSTLLKQLKVTPGEPFRYDVIAEAERRLRQNVYISRVQITPKLNCEGELLLWVMTQDSWAITPGFNYSQIDDETTVDLSLTHANFFGLGHSLSVGYTKREEEDAVRASYFAPRLLNSGIDLSLGITRGDWIDAHNVKLEKPFLTYNTKTAYGISHQNSQFERNIYLRGQSFYRYDYEFDRLNAYWGFSKGVQNDRVGRWRVGFTRTTRLFDNQIPVTETLGPIINRERDLAWIEFNSFSNKFTRLTNIRNIKRIEDISRGLVWRFQFGYATDAIEESDLLRIETGLRYSPIFTEKHILQSAINFGTDWKIDSTEIENGISIVDFNYFWLFRNNQRLLIELVGIHGKHLTLDRLFTQGGATGLRGYPSLYQLGNNSFRSTLEYRYYFQPELLNIFQFATALYADAGRAWFTENIIGVEDYLGDETLWNIGIGLRIASNRIGFGSIAHIDLAFPVNDPPEIPANVVGEPFDDVRFTIVLKSRF